MNKAVPWRIKGVGFDARAAAIDAARRSGMSLGEWLNTVIAEQAETDGVAEDAFDANDRLDAVTRRLSRLRDGREPELGLDDGRRRRSRTRGDQEARDGQNSRDLQDDREGHRDGDGREAVRRPRITSRETFRAEIDAEALLENAIAAFDRRANRSSERTARALAQVAELIDSGKRDRDRDDAALSTIADRLSHIERRVARAPEPQTDTVVHDALVRLERRIDVLGRRQQRAESPEPAPAPAPPVAAIVPPPAPAAPVPAPVVIAPPKRPLADAIAEVVRRQQELDGPRAAPVPARTVPAGRLADATPNPLEARLAALVDRLERTAARPSGERREGPDLGGLQGNISALTDRIEKMRNDIAARPGAPAADRDSDGIAAMRRELSGLARTVADLAPRTSIQALEIAVRDLSARVTESRIDGAGESALAPVEGLLRELLGVVRGTDSRAAIASLDRSIRSVSARLEAFDGATVADPALAHGMAEQTREMRDALARIVENTLPTERIERGLADLSTRVESIAKAGADPLGRGEMAHRVDEIRAMLANPIAPEQVLQGIEHRLEDIAHRVGAVFGERLDSMQRSFAAELEARAKTPDVDALAVDLGDRIDRALSGGLQAMERTVAKLVEASATRPDPRTARLEELVGELATRVDAGAAPGAGPETLEAIHRQMLQLSDHLNKADRTGDTLHALQSSVADLFARIEQGQQGAIDAAETAARNAAAAVVRDAASAAPNASRDVEELRSRQDEADHRTHATLTAVHETLSQVVSRLSSLEDDLEEVRHVAPPAVDERISDVVSRLGSIEDDLEDVRQAAPQTASQAAPQAASHADSYAAPPFAETRVSLAAATERLRQSERLSAFSPDDRHSPSAVPEGDEADVLIEPGTAFDRKRMGGGDARADKPQASFIQAARRAAKAAGAVTSGMPANAAPEDDGAAKPTPLDQVRAYYASRKRPILLSLAALMVIFGAWQVAKVAIDDRTPPSPAALQAPKTSATLLREKAAEKTAVPGDTALAEAASIGVPPLPARKSEPPPVAAVEPPAPPAPAVDRAPVSSIPAPAPTADTNGIVRALATAGDPAAQYELGARYADGKVLARDPKLSQQWFEKAAAKGVVPAQYRLGALFERGLGVAKDPVQAKTWYQKAADAGHARAMHNLAVLFADGSGGKPDYAEAIGWFRRAAEFGVRDSQFNLAILYARGLGTPVNMVESYLWFAAAAAQGDEDAGRKRDDVGGRLSPNDLARAKAFVAAFKAKPLDPAINDAQPPPGGWESVKLPAKPEAKATTRPKVSTL